MHIKAKEAVVGQCYVSPNGIQVRVLRVRSDSRVDVSYMNTHEGYRTVDLHPEHILKDNAQDKTEQGEEIMAQVTDKLPAFGRELGSVKSVSAKGKFISKKSNEQFFLNGNSLQLVDLDKGKVISTLLLSKLFGIETNDSVVHKPHAFVDGLKLEN